MTHMKLDMGQKANIRFLTNGACTDIVNINVLDISADDRPFTAPEITIRGLVTGYHENPSPGKLEPVGIPQMERVMFAPPATIVFWEDGDKTVVKCDKDDTYDKHYGLTLCWMKKLLGGKSRALNDALRAIREQAEEAPETEKEPEEKPKAPDELPSYINPKFAEPEHIRNLVDLVGLEKNEYLKETTCPLKTAVCGLCPAEGQINAPHCYEMLRQAIKGAGVKT